MGNCCTDYITVDDNEKMIVRDKYGHVRIVDGPNRVRTYYQNEDIIFCGVTGLVLVQTGEGGQDREDAVLHGC